MNTARAYLELTKPGITLFIGMTAAAGFVTARGRFDLPLAFSVAVAATMLMSGGAAALNQVFEARWDALMRRTSKRPVPAGIVDLRNARLFAWSLSFAGSAVSLAFLPWQTSLFLALCHVSYVFVYTPLKRRTPLCTLAGAVPGALPVLAGWTAAGAVIDVAALALTGVLFMWQIPHFLAIGWLTREDYARAGCPMLGVVEPAGHASARVSFVYTAAMLVCAVVLGMVTPTGALYMAAAAATGAAYVACAWGMVRQPGQRPARQLFFTSLVVLPVLLSALMADLLLSA